jgi:hypothetical protein
MPSRLPIRAGLVLTTLALAACGCAGPKYAPAAYKPGQERFGVIVLSCAKTLYVCPAIDSLAPECRKRLDPAFSASAHVTQAVEAELKAAGLAPVRPDFTSGASLSGLRLILANRDRKDEQAVYLGTQVRWLSAERWTLDAELLSPGGEVLFEKRGFCVVMGYPKVDAQEIGHMALRQILADPKFKAALP